MFIRDNFYLVGAQNRDGAGGQIYSYVNTDDTLADMKVSGYFNEVRVSFFSGDSIISKGSDGKAIFDVVDSGGVVSLGSEDIRSESPSRLVQVTTTYAVLKGDGFVDCNGTFAVTLYVPVGNEGDEVTVTNVGSGSITVNGTGPLLPSLLEVQHTAITYRSDGIVWRVK